jgi:hypothetical protein
MGTSRLTAGVLLTAAVTLGAAAPASATHNGSDNASCVAQFVTAIPPGARGQAISFGAQDPLLHPFGTESGDWPPEGCELHVCFGDEQDIRVSEVWASQEQLDAFGEKLGAEVGGGRRPALRSAGDIGGSYRRNLLTQRSRYGQ